MNFKLNLMVDGALTEVEFGLADYQAAQDQGLSLSEYINRKYPTPGQRRSRIRSVLGRHWPADG